MQRALLLVPLLDVGQDSEHLVKLLVQRHIRAKKNNLLPLDKELLVRVRPLQRLLVKQVLVGVGQRVDLEV